MKSVKVKGQQHDLVILRVLEWDASGRPSKCEMGYDDTTFRLDDPTKPNEFITAFVNADSLKGATRH